MIGCLDEVEAIVNEHHKCLNILNLYLFGSRLYNCHHQDSDYDLILVTDSEEVSLSTNAIETEKYNINIYHIDYFLFLIRENLIWGLMCCWIPKDFIWKEKFSLVNFASIDKRKLANYTILDISHCYNKSKKLFQNNEKLVGLKNLTHCFREVLFALEILKKGKLDNFELANNYFMKIMNEKNQDWDHFESKYYPELHEFMTQLKNFRVISEKDESSKLSQYLEKYDLNTLTRDFSIHVASLSDELTYVGVIEEPLVNPNLPIIKECCNGILICSKKSIFARAVIKNKEKSFKPIQLLEKYDGINTIMYWMNDKWNLVFKDQFKPKFYRKLATNKIQDNYLREENQLTSEQLESEFWKTFKDKKYIFPSKEYAYNFELCIKNQKICKYQKNELLLIGVYSIGNQMFLNFLEFGEKFSFDIPKVVSIKYENINEELFKLNPLDSEGYVAIDEKFHYQSFRSFQFDSLRQLLHWRAYDDNTITRIMFDLVRYFDGDEYMNHHPWNHDHLISIHKSVKKRFLECLRILDKVTDPLLTLEKEEMTLACKKYQFYYIIFEKMKSNLTYQGILRIQSQKRFQKILKEIETYSKSIK